MSHVGRAENARRPQHGQRTRHALARRQRGAGEAAAVDRLALDGVGAFLARLDDHVVGLADADPELVDIDRSHVVAVGLHHLELQPGNAGIEHRHGRAVDEAQPHFLAGPEQAGPVVGGPAAVHQEGVARDVGEIGRIHAHLAPGQAVGNDRLALLGGLRRAQVAHQARQGALAVVEVARLLLELAQDGAGRHRMMVGEHHHVIARHLVAFAFRRLDDDGRVHALLLLAAGMAVVPVGARLPDLEAVGEGRAGLDAGEAHHRHAVHVVGQQDAVPMDRGVLVQPVGDVDGDIFALLPAQRRSRDLAVDGEDAAHLAFDRQVGAIDHQVVGRGEGRHGRQQCHCEQGAKDHGHGGPPHFTNRMGPFIPSS